MTFDEYSTGERSRYAAFVEAVRHILSAAVKAADMKPHAITGRAKDLVSLRKKLDDNEIPLDSAIEIAVKDLAGARIVFLTNTQVDAFRNSGIVRANFDVVNVNEHHPVPGTETEKRLFDSTNVCVVLKEDRTALPEYSDFAGLKCEIQVQTLLNHAWAEMSHDTSYKGPDLEHVDKDRLARIDQRLDAVMNDHLLPAGHDFDKIARDFRLLVQANRDYQPTVDAVASSTSNNTLSAALDTLNDVVLPRIADRAGRFLDLLPAIVAAVERTRGTPAETVETPYPFPGETGEDVARKAASVIEHHRHADPPAVLAALIRLYRGAADDERSVWLDLGRRFAENSIPVFRTHGPIIQRIVVDALAALSLEDLAAIRDLALAMLEKVASSEISGTAQADFHVINFQMGAIPVGQAVRQMRADAITLLGQLMDASADDLARLTVLAPLNEACRVPFNGASEAIRILVMNDAADVAAIWRRTAATAGIEVRRRMEVDALHVHSWYHILPEAMAGNAELAGAQQRLIPLLIGLRDDLEADADYVLYRKLVGHDSVHPSAWAGRHFDHEALDQWRQTEWPGIIASIDADDPDAWVATARRYLREPMGLSDHVALAKFVRGLSAAKPRIAVHILDVADDALSPLLVALLVGLDTAGQSDAAIQAAHRFADEGRYLANLAWWLADRAMPSIGLLIDFIARARELGDDRGVVALMDAAGKQYSAKPDPALISEVLMPCVEHAIRASLTGWPRDAFWVGHSNILGALNDAQSARILDSIVGAAKVTHDAERLLTKIADRSPQLVLDFFEARARRVPDENGERVEPVPFHLNELRVPLARHPGPLLSTARRMHDARPAYHQFFGGRLVAQTFPALEPALARAITALVAGGNRDDLAFVLATLQPYEGAEAVLPVAMDVVDRLDEGDPLLGQVSSVLGETGIVSGQFGWVEAVIEQRRRLEPYATDPRPRVEAFARLEIRALTQAMASEQRRALHEDEQMRRDWDGTPDGPAAAEGPSA